METLDTHGYKMRNIKEALDEVRRFKDSNWTGWYREITYLIKSGKVKLTMCGWLYKEYRKATYHNHHGIYDNRSILIILDDDIAHLDVKDEQDVADRIAKQIKEIEEVFGMPVAEACKLCGNKRSR